MSVPSMVHRSGDSLIVRSVVSGDALYGDLVVGLAAAADDDDQPPEKELPECKVKRNYACPSCDFFTQNPRSYLYHLRDIHEEKVRIYECPNCLYASKHFQKLLRHAKMLHGDTSSAEHNSKRFRNNHSKTQVDIVDGADSGNSDEDLVDVAVTSPNHFKCSVCNFLAKSRALLQKHERDEHIKTKFFRCAKCSYATHMKARFTKHVKYHSMPMIKCDMCDFRTPYKWNLDRHCKNHNGKGAFKCSACNFTADIKQSLTVHEMNHHVPPVGQAAGLGVGRRRNKVGASDATAAEDAAIKQQEEIDHQVSAAVSTSAIIDASSSSSSSVPETSSVSAATPHQKSKSSSSFGPDFVHPDDIVQHANGNYYFKTKKCTYCNYKAAFDKDMTKHERKVHNIVKDSSTSSSSTSPPQSTANKSPKKTTRPIPNLIPIPAQTAISVKFAQKQHLEDDDDDDEDLIEPMSEQDIEKICANSTNSALKDFAPLCGSEDVFTKNATGLVKNFAKTVPELSFISDLAKNRSAPSSRARGLMWMQNFRQKNASFFDSLKDKLLMNSSDTLTCDDCGHESKCLTELIRHQAICEGQKNSTKHLLNLSHHSLMKSSRCQYCRQRCKSTTDLYNHLHQCQKALKILSQRDAAADELKIDETRSQQSDSSVEYSSNTRTNNNNDTNDVSAGGDDDDTKPHPMENRVFVWNNIEVPMDLEVDESKYEYVDNDNISLDMSIRTQSPTISENSYVGQEYSSSTPTNNHSYQNHRHRSSPLPPSGTSDKIPTHGNDISVAQHKRVFKCPHCTFWASTASRFHVHIVGHLNKKPFECSLCSYRSNWRWDITKHIKLKSVRDPQHQNAKVLMTDETGRRNYSKYNRYLTEIHVSGSQSLDTSGGSGTRPKHGEKSPNLSKTAPDSNSSRTHSHNKSDPDFVVKSLRPPPGLKAADSSLFNKNAAAASTSSSTGSGKNHGHGRNGGDSNKRTLFKCKKCNFRDASREILLAHVKGHYSGSGCVSGGGGASHLENMTANNSGASLDKSDEASVSASAAKGTQAPFRCGHCNQVSNWKHVIQRHCRLKHSGDIRVVSNKNGQERLEIEEQTDEPDHVDVLQDGLFKCSSCPFSTDDQFELQVHLPGHSPNNDSVMKCHYCNFFVNQKEQLFEHLRLHGVADPEDFFTRIIAAPNSLEGGDLSKRFKCVTCPYVTNSKSQYTYHKQFHKPRGGQYTCSHCSYNVSKRHLLHQHLKVHGIHVPAQKQNGAEIVDLGEMSDEIEEITANHTSSPSCTPIFDSASLADIPLVWVSKHGKFSKMFKCRYCPHVNMRKSNIQEHEKMHSIRERNPNSSSRGDVEHRCNDCNYICNNAGVLSSHLKVHQGLYGRVHGLVDIARTDDEQIQEFAKNLGPDLDDGEEETTGDEIVDEIPPDMSSGVLFFCQECPARFLKDTEFKIHENYHGGRLFYKCANCSFSARQKPHLLSHAKVHSSEYQERTMDMKNMYPAINEQPELQQKLANSSQDFSDDDFIWVVRSTSPDLSGDNLSAMINNNSRQNSSAGMKLNNVPLSGTELFAQKQKSEAEHKHKEEMGTVEEPPQKIDPQFGVLMRGNPKFTYPTYMKNGRMKEKRYKCHKCPSAFEKREQYKVHLNLHGSNQKYNCDHCDYSVKYYANYVQHMKKHKLNSEAAGKSLLGDSSPEQEEIMDADDEEVTSLADQQVSNILQNRLLQKAILANNNNGKDEPAENPKKSFNCPYCPYVNHRRDAVENHQKRHISVSGVRNSHTCEHCDYSVAQVHILKDHTRLHFAHKNPHVANNNSLDAFMVCDNLKLVSRKQQDEPEAVDSENKSVIFEEKLGAFLPDVEDANAGAEIERKFVDKSGEIVVNVNNKMDES